MSWKSPDDADRRQFENELRTIAALVAKYRDEFDAGVAGLGAAVQMSDLRAKRRRAL